METISELLSKAIQPAPVQRELKPLNNGVQEFEQALNGIKIINASVSELQAILRRVFILVGIRANNLPSPEETQILTAFIFKKYASLTLEEIQLAFEKAVAGELELEDVSCYENFTCEYFGRIMAAYKKWAAQKFNENQMYLVKPQENNLLTMQADWKELCELNYQQFLTGNYNIDLWPWQMYDEFVKCGMMEENVFEDFLNKSYKSLISKDYETQKEKEKLFEIKTGFLNHHAVVEGAKRLAVKLLYYTARDKGLNNLFTV